VKQEEPHKEETYSTVEVPVNEPSYQETQKALNKLKTSKALHYIHTVICREEKIRWKESVQL